MAVDKKKLRDINITFLAEDIIREIAKSQGINNRSAMEVYYCSKLCQQNACGEYGIEYMDYKYHANDLMGNEPE